MDKPTEFEQAGADGESNFFLDFWLFLCQNKKWWLLPLVVMLLAMALLTLFSGTAAAPFIYTLF